MTEEGQGIEKTSIDLFWPTFAFVCGVLIAVSFTRKVAEILLFLANLLYYRSWLIFAVLAIAVICYFALKYFEQMEQVRIETALSKEYREQIKDEVKTDLAARIRHADRVTENIQGQRLRLQKISGNIIQQTDELQQDQTSFIYFVEQVTDLLGRRSKKLQAELPDNPVQVEKIKNRDEKLRTELNEVLQAMSETFPELAGNIPVLEPPVEEHIDTLYLKRAKPGSGRIDEYRRKRVKVASGTKSTLRR